jgi:hypothetical protein
MAVVAARERERESVCVCVCAIHCIHWVLSCVDDHYRGTQSRWCSFGVLDRVEDLHHVRILDRCCIRCGKHTGSSSTASAATAAASNTTRRYTSCKSSGRVAEVACLDLREQRIHHLDRTIGCWIDRSIRRYSFAQWCALIGGLGLVQLLFLLLLLLLLQQCQAFSSFAFQSQFTFDALQARERQSESESETISIASIVIVAQRPRYHILSYQQRHGERVDDGEQLLGCDLLGIFTKPKRLLHKRALCLLQ